MKKIQEFAKKRGDIVGDFTVFQMQLPFSLIRYEYMMQGGNLTESYLNQLVDEVLMPIYLNYKEPSL